jgi:hypothetical protein
MINDLPFAREFMSLLYADDTSFLIEADDIQTLYQKANKQLASAESWFLDNRLTLHPSKTRYMVYSKVDSIPDTLQLSMLGHQILRVCENGPEKTFKLVGVHIDEKLTFKHHITTVQKKIAESAESWFLDNRLTLHPSKTRYMVYSKVDSIPDTLQLCMLGHQILRVCEHGPEKTFKLVGVHIDEKLTFKHHITTVQKKIAEAEAKKLYQSRL